ncbi:MAG: potassium-transporting ATPase subunit KdpA, partial [Methanobacterium paludis]|nr:potassium-transporting ATPase subunit KdpA [Methanobacterium paludis]
MDANGLIYIILFFVIAVLLAWPLGKYMSKVLSGEKTFMTPLVRPVEKFMYRICGVDEAEEMTWKGYAKALIVFNILAILFVFVIQIMQGLLPLNPEGFSGVRWDTALNTAISFVTNTNWQAYAGETTMSYLTQMVGRPVEKFIYRICGVDEAEEMTWKGYAKALIIFNILAILFVFVIQIMQGLLPLNPEGFSGVRWDTALNTAISFVTNTNWQSYAGETTMSYLTQMVGLAVQNFLSAAVGMAAALVLIRGFIRKNTDKLGNFWVDITRMVLYILLPLSLILAILLVSQGVVQTFDPYATAQTIEGASQIIPLGPVASQEAIKMIGSNGGGFFNVNSAHPFENPNGFTNFLETLAILLIPISMVFMFGYLVRNIKQGLALFAVMMVLMVMGLGVALWSENHPNPVIEKMGVTGENLEGKEVRFGTTNSVLWGVLTTDVSNGGVNSMHDSTMPLTGLVYMFNMGTGEVIFGGIGVGL